MPTLDKNYTEKSLKSSLLDSLFKGKQLFSGLLIRIKTSDESGVFRNDFMHGDFALPEIGLPFVMVSEAYDLSGESNRARFLATSAVIEIEELNEEEYNLKTRNSIYTLKVRSSITKPH